MHPSARRGHWLVVGLAVFMLAVALLLAAGWWLVAHAEAGWVWLGTPLTEQVAARLEPNNPASTDANFLSAAYQPAKTVRGWHIVSAQAGNFYPLWQSLLDDDPTYVLSVEVDVDYASGQRERVTWTTWRYGLVLGPLVLTAGDGPSGELAPLVDLVTP